MIPLIFIGADLPSPGGNTLTPTAVLSNLRLHGDAEVGPAGVNEAAAAACGRTC